MPEYTVIERSILTGTISDLPYSARLAWTAVLFEAEAGRGRVKLPPRELARMAAITPEEALDALEMFQRPDPLSASKDCAGVRLMAIPGEPNWYQAVTWERHEKERAAYFVKVTGKAAKRIEPSNARPTPETFAPDSRPFRAAAYLLKKIRANNPKAKEPNMQEWARDIDRILRIDKRTPAELAKVIDWCQADPFWLKNILSPAKLRKHFDRLQLALNDAPAHEKPVTLAPLAPWKAE